MELTKMVLKTLMSRVPTSEYSVLLNETLEKFFDSQTEGQLLASQVGEIESESGLNAWETKYTQWQLRSEEVRDLKRRLAERRPKVKALRNLHNGLVILMNNRNVEMTQTFNMLLRAMQENDAGSEQAKLVANRAERDGDGAVEYCRKQIAKLRTENPELLDTLHLPEWVIEM